MKCDYCGFSAFGKHKCNSCGAPKAETAPDPFAFLQAQSGQYAQNQLAAMQQHPGLQWYGGMGLQNSNPFGRIFG